MTIMLPRRRGSTKLTGAAIAFAMAAAGLIATATPASAAADPWESESGIYHLFTVPRSSVPSNTCGNSTGAGAELEGNIGPGWTWAAVGLDSSGNNCQANIGPMTPGLYYYQYVSTNAQRAKTVFRNSTAPVEVTSHPNWNTLFVPGPEVAWMDDVAGGGSVSELAYFGPANKAAIWTPADYDAERAEPYSTLYLLADSGQSYLEWQELGRARQILDNLDVNGDLADMVVVMAYVTSASYQDVIQEGLVPTIEDYYNVSADGADRAVAGIGRGAQQALGVAAADPGYFASVGSFSGTLPAATFTAENAAAVNDATDVLRFYVGNVLDPNYNATYEAMAQATAAGVDFQFDGIHPETGGVWDTWRENLRDFASRVFSTSADPGLSAGHRALTEPYTPPATGSITTPNIDANGIVTFETGTQWSTAKDVVLWGDWAPNGQWFRIPLTKVGDRWRLSMGPVDGYYYWRYEVDGRGYHDPEDLTNTNTVESQLFVPGGVRTPLLADLPPDQTGTVTVTQYASAYSGANAQMKLKVWTPPDYDADRAEPYPVMYLYHGMDQNFASWTETGRADKVFDNLYAQGKMSPMVVVMPGYPGTTDFWNDLSSRVIPLIRSSYNISTDPAKTALAGLSWGARGTMQTYTNAQRLVQFAYYGVFSPPMGSSLNGTTGPLARTNIKLVTLFAGDRDSGAVSANNTARNNLNTYNVPNVNTVVPGPHGFDIWWQGLIDFAPRIFIDRPALDAIIAEAESKEAAVYTADSFAALTEALDAAKAVSAQPNNVINYETVTAAISDLRVAIDALVEGPPNITASIVAKCIAGKATLSVSLTNAESGPVALDLATSYGNKAFGQVASGKKASATFSTLTGSPASAEWTVTAARVGGETFVLPVSFGGATCS